MATFLLAWELGAGTGHSAKLLPIITKLAAQKHRVFVAGRDVTVMRRLFGSLEVEYLQAPFLVPRPTNPVEAPRCFAHMLHNTGFGDQQQLEPLVLAWRSLIKLISPDVMICEHAPMALLASRYFNLRRVVVGTGFSVPPDVWPPADLCNWMPPDYETLQADELSVLNRINRLLAVEGKPLLERLGQLYSQVDESFVVTFPELDHYPQRSNTKYWGVWSPPGGIVGEWSNERGPKLFAYLKPPLPNWRLKEVLANLREFRVNALIYMPGISPLMLKGVQAPHIRFVTQRLDIRQVARECDLAILHGTAGTTTELLLRGVPQLNIPLFLEQAIMSRRVAAVGAGLYSPPNRPELFSEQLTELLGQSKYRDAAQAFSRRYDSYDAQQSMAEAVRQIDALLR
jgi:hypothetical protein